MPSRINFIKDFSIYQSLEKKDVNKSTDFKIKNIVKKILEPFKKIYNFIYFKNPITQKRHFWFIPTSFEKFAGYWMYSSYVFGEGGKTFDEKNARLIEKIGKDLTIKTKRDLKWEFTVIRSPKINAFCLPGGKIGIYDGILEGIEKVSIKGYEDVSKEDKIAAVLAHEVNHAAIGHTARSIEKLILLNLLLIGFKIYTSLSNIQKTKENEKDKKKQFGINDILEMVANTLMNLFVKIYLLAGSRSQEYEADKYGMHLMERAGYNPKAALWLQEFLITREVKRSKWMTKIYDFFSTHPNAKSRLEKNKQTLKEIEISRKNI